MMNKDDKLMLVAEFAEVIGLVGFFFGMEFLNAQMHTNTNLHVTTPIIIGLGIAILALLIIIICFRQYGKMKE